MRCERSTPDFSVCSVVFSDPLTADVRLGFDSIRIPTFEGVLFSGFKEAWESPFHLPSIPKTLSV